METAYRCQGRMSGNYADKNGSPGAERNHFFNEYRETLYVRRHANFAKEK